VPSNEELVFEFEILPIEIDVSGLEFDNLNFTYDGQKHYPALTDIPAHVLVTTYLHWADNENNNSEEYEGKRLAVDVGTYGCKITLRAESSNYVLLGTTTYTASFEIDKTPIDISERFIDDFKLIYTEDRYNEDILKAVLLDGIDAYVECLPGACYFETAENQWQYTPTMIESGRYKITVRFKIKDSNNYSLVYDGIELLEKSVDVYFMVV
jgi:hypothetical protein